MTKQLLTFVPYLLSRSSSLADAAPLSLELCCLAPPLSSSFPPSYEQPVRLAEISPP